MALLRDSNCASVSFESTLVGVAILAVTLWVSLPLDQVLELASITSVGSNCLDFILFFAFDHVRWWPRVVLAMFHGLDIRHKE